MDAASIVRYSNTGFKDCALVVLEFCEMNFPKRRKTGLILREIGGETLIYDKKTLKASCLDGLAADIWRQCDGRTSTATIARSVSSKRQEEVDEQAVWLALEKLGKSDLLERTVETPAFLAARTSRRNAMKAIGVGGAVASVTTIVVPSIADAASCLPSGSPCTPGGTACCSGLSCVATGSR